MAAALVVAVLASVHGMLADRDRPFSYSIVTNNSLVRDMLANVDSPFSYSIISNDSIVLVDQATLPTSLTVLYDDELREFPLMSCAFDGGNVTCDGQQLMLRTEDGMVMKFTNVVCGQMHLADGFIWIFSPPVAYRLNLSSLALKVGTFPMKHKFVGVYQGRYIATQIENQFSWAITDFESNITFGTDGPLASVDNSVMQLITLNPSRVLSFPIIHASNIRPDLGSSVMSAVLESEGVIVVVTGSLEVSVLSLPNYSLISVWKSPLSSGQIVAIAAASRLVLVRFCGASKCEDPSYFVVLTYLSGQLLSVDQSSRGVLDQHGQLSWTILGHSVFYCNAGLLFQVSSQVLFGLPCSLPYPNALTGIGDIVFLANLQVRTLIVFRPATIKILSNLTLEITPRPTDTSSSTMVTSNSSVWLVVETEQLHGCTMTCIAYHFNGTHLLEVKRFEFDTGSPSFVGILSRGDDIVIVNKRQISGMDGVDIRYTTGLLTFSKISVGVFAPGLPSITHDSVYLGCYKISFNRSIPSTVNTLPALYFAQPPVPLITTSNRLILGAADDGFYVLDLSAGTLLAHVSAPSSVITTWNGLILTAHRSVLTIVNSTDFVVLRQIKFAQGLDITEIYILPQLGLCVQRISGPVCYQSIHPRIQGIPTMNDEGLSVVKIYSLDSWSAAAVAAVTPLLINVVPCPVFLGLAPIDIPSLMEFSMVIPSSAFLNKETTPLTYSLSSAPDWLKLENATLKGTAVDVDYSTSITITLVATNGKGGSTEGDLHATLYPYRPPVVVNAVSNQQASVGVAFRITLSRDIFQDPQQDQLNVTVEGLPEWLKYDAVNRILAGTPGRVDTNFFRVRDVPITLIATNQRSRVSSSFFITVGGVSWGEVVFKIVAPVFSALSVGYTAYRLRHVLFCNYWRWHKYTRSIESYRVGEPFVCQLQTSALDIHIVRAVVPNPRKATLSGKVQRKCCLCISCCCRCAPCRRLSKAALEPPLYPLPTGDLPYWLQFHDPSELVGCAPKPKQLTVQVIGKDFAILEQFKLIIRADENGTTASNGRKTESSSRSGIRSKTSVVPLVRDQRDYVMLQDL